MLLFGVVALFISVVTLASFVKFLGTTFWGSWPGEEPPQVMRDVPFTMQLPQVVLAVACVALGLAPVAAVSGLFRVTQALGPAGYWPAFGSLFHAGGGALAGRGSP